MLLQVLNLPMLRILRKDQLLLMLVCQLYKCRLKGRKGVTGLLRNYGQKANFFIYSTLVFSVIFESVWLDAIILISASQNQNRTELNVFYFIFLIGFFSRFDIFGFFGLISFLFFLAPVSQSIQLPGQICTFKPFFFSSCIFFPLHTYIDLSFKEFYFFLQPPVKPINPKTKN